MGSIAGLVLTRGVIPLVLSRWMTKANAGDPKVLVGGALVLALVSALACAIPALRASRVDPMRVRRSE